PGAAWWRGGKILGCTMAGLSLLLFLNFSQNYMARTKPYARIVDELRAMLPHERLKVAGPSVLWFAWDKELFRDSGAIVLSYWYTGGRRDLKAWLGTWQPDILILDRAMQIVVKRPG